MQDDLHRQSHSLPAGRTQRQCVRNSRTFKGRGCQGYLYVLLSHTHTRAARRHAFSSGILHFYHADCIEQEQVIQILQRVSFII